MISNLYQASGFTSRLFDIIKSRDISDRWCYINDINFHTQVAVSSGVVSFAGHSKTRIWAKISGELHLLCAIAVTEFFFFFIAVGNVPEHMPNAPHSLMPYAIAQKEEKTIGVHRAGEKRDFLPFLSRLRNVRRRSFAITGAKTNAEGSTQKKKKMHNRSRLGWLFARENRRWNFLHAWNFLRTHIACENDTCLNWDQISGSCLFFQPSPQSPAAPILWTCGMRQWATSAYLCRPEKGKEMPNGEFLARLIRGIPCSTRLFCTLRVSGGSLHWHTKRW